MMFDTTMCRFFVERSLMALILAWPQWGWAQFDKTAWAARTPTPMLQAVDLQGQAWTLAEMRGQTVVLNFWATWCAPCKEELPTLQTLHDMRDANTRILTVNVREPTARVARYAQTTQLNVPVLLDPQGELAKRWGVSVFPTTILIGPDGQARWRVLGEVDWSGPQAQGWLADLSAKAAPATGSNAKR
jgi:thiol-disulfide isomerase/thioredoxin